MVNDWRMVQLYLYLHMRRSSSPFKDYALLFQCMCIYCNNRMHTLCVCVYVCVCMQHGVLGMCRQTCCRYSAAVICIIVTHSFTHCTCHCSSYVHFHQSSHALLPVHASCAPILARLLAVIMLHGYLQDVVRLSCCLPSSCYFLSIISLLGACHTASPMSSSRTVTVRLLFLAGMYLIQRVLANCPNSLN